MASVGNYLVNPAGHVLKLLHRFPQASAAMERWRQNMHNITNFVETNLKTKKHPKLLESLKTETGIHNFPQTQ